VDPRTGLDAVARKKACPVMNQIPVVQSTDSHVTNRAVGTHFLYRTNSFMW